MQERVPPQSIEAEQSVLGAMLIERAAIAKANNILQEEDFYREAHRVIYRAIRELDGRGEPADMVMLTEVLRRDNKLDAVGGILYITNLANAVPTAANVGHHASLVAEKALLRRLVSCATEIASSGYEANEELDVILDKAEKKILEIGRKRLRNEVVPIKTFVHAVMDMIDELYQTSNKITGLETGFSEFDQMLAGLQPSDLIIVAARPGMGKTSFVLNIAQHVAVRKKQAVGFFSLEMSKEQLVQRLLCSEAEINLKSLRAGDVEEKAWPRLAGAANRLSESAIFIDDNADITVLELRSRARRLKHEYDIKLLVIDYLQLMQGQKGKENRQQEIADISRSIKALARELGIPVIALSQLSRSVESRGIKRPQLSDLRESGALEQDADVVAFLYRENYYWQLNPEGMSEPENKNLAELIIAKHRNGETGSIKLLFDPRFTKFRNAPK